MPTDENGRYLVRMRLPRTAVLLGAAALVAAGCSGDDDAAAATTAPAVEVTTTLDAPATTDTSTTPTTVNPTTTAPPPSSTSTSTPTPESDLTDEEQVIAAYTEAYESFWAASQDPNNPELRRRLAAKHADNILRRSVEALDEYVINGERVIPNPDREDGFEIESVEIDGDAATVISCTTNPWLLVVGTGSDQKLVDGNVYVTRDEGRLERRSAKWIVVDGNQLIDFSEQGRCED